MFCFYNIKSLDRRKLVIEKKVQLNAKWLQSSMNSHNTKLNVSDVAGSAIEDRFTCVKK